ncbi:TPA: hypothetical protein M4K80_001886 [Salmonella enterica]|nr:hypothetical protein [Salmonella enterica]
MVQKFLGEHFAAFVFVQPTCQTTDLVERWRVITEINAGRFFWGYTSVSVDGDMHDCG